MSIFNCTKTEETPQNSHHLVNDAHIEFCFSFGCFCFVSGSFQSVYTESMYSGPTNNLFSFSP